MPIPALVGAALVSAGATGASQAANAISQGNLNKKNREFTREMWDKQNAVNDANWHRDNFYNSPANQRKLLEEGGYNPALMYDQGGFQSASSPAAPTASSPVTKSPEFDGGAIMSSYYNAKMQSAQLDNIEGATRNAAIATASDVGLKAAQTAASTFDTSQRMRLADVSAAAAQKANDLLDADISLRKNQGYKAVDERQKIVEEIKAIKQSTSQQADAHPLNMETLKNNVKFQQFKANLNDLGITERDGVIWRLFAKFGSSLGRVYDHVPSKAPNPVANPKRPSTW